MRTGLIIQARMGSKRLPGKVLEKVLGRPLLWYMLRQVRRCTSVSKIVVATTVSTRDEAIETFCREYGADCYRGSEEDVLDRYYQCAKIHQMDNVVRVTADCPLIEPSLVDGVVRYYLDNPDYDLVKTGRTYPEGFDAEILSFRNLETAWKEAKAKSQREHVTTFLWENDERFRVKWLSLDRDYSFLRLTVDEPVDLDVVRAVIGEFARLKKDIFGFEDILSLREQKPELFEKNAHVIRNEGYLKSKQEDESGTIT